jgi:hypothetical protein
VVDGGTVAAVVLTATLVVVDAAPDVEVAAAVVVVVAATVVVVAAPAVVVVSTPFESLLLEHAAPMATNASARPPMRFPMGHV